VWTIEEHVAAGHGYGWCEILTFSASTWTADHNGDQGTYSEPGSDTIVLTFTSGGDFPAGFSGTMVTSKKYKGTFSNSDISLPAKLLKGAKSETDDGYPC
jgi:hypothetical protein